MAALEVRLKRGECRPILGADARRSGWWQLRLQRLPRRIVGRIVGGVADRVEVDQAAEAIGVQHADAGQLGAGHRVADQHRGFQAERLDDRPHVIRERRLVVAGRGHAGRAVAPPRDAVDVTAILQLQREVVVDVRGVAGAREQHHVAAGAAPVEDLELDVRRDGDPPHRVRRRIRPRGRGLAVERRRGQDEEPEQRQHAEHRHDGREWQSREGTGVRRTRRRRADRDGRPGHVVADPSVGAGVVVSVNVLWRSAAAPISPPMPIESSALLGTSISAPFSLSPS